MSDPLENFLIEYVDAVGGLADEIEPQVYDAHETRSVRMQIFLETQDERSMLMELEFATNARGEKGRSSMAEIAWLSGDVQRALADLPPIVPLDTPHPSNPRSNLDATGLYLSRFYYGERYAGGKADGHFILAWKLPHLNKL
jgi:hypothetical protein